MAIKRVKKQAKAKAAKKAAVNVRTCKCGVQFKETDGKGRYVITSMLDLAVYCCSERCYLKWCAEHPAVASCNERRIPEEPIKRDPGTPLF